MEVFSSTFEYNTATDGGIMSIQLTSTLTENSFMRMSQNDFFYSNASDAGGIAVISHSMLDVQFDNNDYEENNGYVGGIFYIADCGTLRLMEEEFQGNNGEFGRIVYSIAAGLAFSISDTLVEWEDFNYTLYEEYIANNTQNSSSSFYFTGSGTTIESIKNTFTNNNLAKKGGVFYLNNVNFTDYGSKFFNNSALLGGAITCQECVIDLDGSIFELNYGKYGGALYLESEAKLTMHDAEFRYNNAYSSGGCVFITTRSHFYIYDSIFEYNTADSESAISALMTSDTYPFEISNVAF
mmetsp:Transcript_9840/g.9689  ORF Transcript_9840/g.9689 Transcript_9840/m.9689 type:complete len:296 (+) Transcript_9840:274-1161(+)